MLGSRTVVTAAPVSSFSCACIVISPRLCFALCDGWVCEFTVSYFPITRLLSCSCIEVFALLYVMIIMARQKWHGKKSGGGRKRVNCWRFNLRVLVFF